MAHEIEQQDQMRYVGEVPWHDRGIAIAADADVEEWKKQVAPWTVNKEPIFWWNNPGAKDATPMRIPDRVALVRSDTRESFAIVSNRYNVVQPADVLDFFKDLVSDLGGFTMETAGTLRNGRKVWALAKAKDSIRLGKEDVVDRYLLLATSYDMTIMTVAQQTSIRVVCNNTLTAAYNAGEGGKEKQFRVSHITRFDGDRLKEKLSLDEQWKDFAKAVNLLAKKKAGDKVAEEFFLDVFYPEKIRESEAYSEKGARKRVDEVMGIYHEAPGQEFSVAKGTVWGLLNAVTFFTDHVAKSSDADARLDKAWFGDGASIKSRAFERAMAFATK